MNGNAIESDTKCDSSQYDEISYESSEEEFWEEVSDTEDSVEEVIEDDESYDENVVDLEEMNFQMTGGGENGENNEIGTFRDRTEILDHVRSILNIDNSTSNNYDSSSVTESSCSSNSRGSGSSTHGDKDGNRLHHSDFRPGRSTPEGEPSQETSEEEPIDYDQECRKIIAMAYPNLEYPETMTEGCDLRNLYNTLKEHHPLLMKGDNLDAITNVNIGNVSDYHEYEVIDDSSESFESSKSTERDGVATAPTLLQVDKWFERNAQDPDDYEEACRQLSRTIYGEHDPDHNIDTMLSRSSHQNLYRYLKNYHWYLVHTNQFVEGGVCNRNVNNDYENSDENFGAGISEEVQQHPNDSGDEISTDAKDTTISENRGMNPPPTSNVKCLASLFAAKSDSYHALQKQTYSNNSQTIKSTNSENFSSKEKNTMNIKFASEKNDNCDVQVRKIVDENEEVLLAWKGSSADISEHSSFNSNTELNNDSAVMTTDSSGVDSERGDSKSIDDPNVTISHAENSSVRSPLNDGTKGTSERKKCSLTEDDANDIKHDDVGNKNEDISSHFSSSDAGKTDSIHALNEVQETELDQKLAQKLQQMKTIKKTVKDVEEIEWRKNKIQENLKSIIEETEKCELEVAISEQLFIALHAASLTTALTKKYYDSKKERDIYYPSVKKALHDFSLIEEAEKNFVGEFPFDVATALCTVAASRLRGDINEVDENESFVQRATVNVVLGDEDSISLDDAVEGNEQEHGREPSSTKLQSENNTRKRRIKNDLLALIEYAEENGTEGVIEDEVIEALFKAANRMVFVKKYFDVETDEFVYYPSVAKTIIDSSLFEKAGHFYSNDAVGFPAKYVSALREAALTFDEFSDVDELDDYVINMTVDVAISDADDGDEFSKFAESSLTAASELSSSKNENSVTKEASLADEDSCSDGCVRPRNRSPKVDSKYEEPADNFEMQRKEDCTRIQKVSEAMDGDLVKEKVEVKSASNEQNHLEYLAKSCFNEETKVSEMPCILEFERREDEQKLEKDINIFKEKRRRNASQASAESQRLEESHRVAEARLDKKGSLLKEKYMNDIRTNEAVLINLESSFALELERLGREINECRIQRDREWERIESEGKEMKGQLLAEERNLTEQTKTLQEKLCSALADLELERIGMEDIERDSVEDKRKGWFDFGGSSKKHLFQAEKDRKKKLVEFKLKELELEEDIDDIKEDIDELLKEAMAVKDRMKGLQAGVDQQHSMLDSSATELEEKLKRDIEHIQLFYENERERLSKQKNDLENTRIGDDELLASERKKMIDEFDLGREQLTRANIERAESEHEDENILNKNAVALYEKWIKEGSALMLEPEAIKREKMEREKLAGVEKTKTAKLQPKEGCEPSNNAISKEVHVEKKAENIGFDESPFSHAYRSNRVTSFCPSTEVERLEGGKALEGEGNIEEFPGEQSPLSNSKDYSEKNEPQGRETQLRSFDEQTKSTTDHLTCLHQPKAFEEESSLNSANVFDSPRADEYSKKKFLGAALKAREQELQGKETQLRSFDEQTKSTTNHLTCLYQPKSFEEESSLNSANVFDSPRADEYSKKKFLGAALKVRQQEIEKETAKTPSAQEQNQAMHIKVETNRRSARSPTTALAEKRRKAEQARNRAIAIRNGTSHEIKSSYGIDRTYSKDSVAENSVAASGVPQNVEIVHVPVENRPFDTKALHSKKCRQIEEERTVDSASIDFSMNLPSPFPSPSLQRVHPIHPMIMEADRLAGYIRRYQNKLEKVCKSLLTLASVRGEPEALTAREFNLPEMYSFIVAQDWYKARFPDTNSLDLPHLRFSRAKANNGNGADSGGNNGYTITTTGKLFLELDGPVESDIRRFLTFLDSKGVALTRDSMLDHWNEISRLSGDAQSQRVCRNLDKMISFCFDSRMIQK